jgi:hypothetical protein
MYFYLLKNKQSGDNKPYTPGDSFKSNNNRLYGSNFYRIILLKLILICTLDCDGLVCLYNGTIDLNSCKCRCESYVLGKQRENLNCSTLSDACDYGKDKSLCTIYSNIPYECPKFIGRCDRYDQMKKYYDSIGLLTDIKIQTNKNTQSISSLGNNSISLVFIQLIIVHCVLLLSK